MMKFVRLFMLVALLFVGGCTNKDIADYNDDDIAAIVRGEEVTVGELRILYTEEKILDMIDGTIKMKLVVQEAKRMNLDVTDEIEQEVATKMNILLDDTKGSSWESIRDFAEVQSEKLGITKEIFYERYIELTTVQNTYMNAYVEELLGEHGEGVDDLQEYNRRANDLLNELVAKHEAEIEVLIK